jgi:hypothetical protein
MRNGYKGGVRVGFMNINDVRGEHGVVKLMK